ncbi:MAG: MaoC family dehydratase [Pseudomonadota bacterium]
METLDYADVPAAVGRRFGPGPWLIVDQAMIDAFAEATGDRQWIHVDRARAAREIGGTIAHGYLTLALLPRLRDGVLDFSGCARLVNYGLDRLRFPAPVPAGGRVRLLLEAAGVQQARTGLLLTLDATVEIENEARPALAARTLTLLEPADAVPSK